MGKYFTDLTYFSITNFFHYIAITCTKIKLFFSIKMKSIITENQVFYERLLNPSMQESMETFLFKTDLKSNPLTNKVLVIFQTIYCKNICTHVEKHIPSRMVQNNLQQQRSISDDAIADIKQQELCEILWNVTHSTYMIMVSLA